MRFDRDLKVDLAGDDVRVLHSTLYVLQLQVPDLESHHARFGAGTHRAICGFQHVCGLEPSGVVDEPTASALGQAVDSLTFVVAGTVLGTEHASPRGLSIVVVDRSLQEDVVLAEVATDSGGHYVARFSARALIARYKTRPDLEVRVYAGTELIAKSATRYNAGRNETIDVVLPERSTALPSEYESLLIALQAACAGSLASLVESEERRDITYLANKTGWDARLIAMAAVAEQLACECQGPIDPAFYYALFRAGASTAGREVYGTTAEGATAIWRIAIDQGVIPRALADAIPAAAEIFHSLAAVHGSEARIGDGVSTIDELARVTFGNDTAKLQRFAALRAQHAGDGEAFRGAVAEAFGETTAGRVEVDGKLGSLTLDNAPLIAKLHAAQQTPMTAESDLALRGYFKSEQWDALVANAPIPAAIRGETDEARRATYAKTLAAQVRMKFPTAVVAAQVRDGELTLSSLRPEARNSVQEFLVGHHDKFDIARQAVGQYVARNQLGGQIGAGVVSEIERIQRVYQITPGDASMIGLLDKNVHSAYHITRHSEDEFVRGYADSVGGEETARAVWARAQQVHNAVLNIAAHYLVARTAPPIGVHSPPGILDQTPEENEDVVAYPTLAKLFGSMDFCSCEHCRSILSPAAYLVDLLHFLDRDPPANTQLENAQSVLFRRRPDIEHLKLSCENTNKALPYIDIVTETLEYFVANGSKTNPPSLKNYTGHDTDATVKSEELLASPQFVDAAAYEELRTAIFPPPLPFHRGLETLRRYFDKLGVPLHVAMQMLRVDDAVERPGGYGWRDILIERLGLSREEYDVLTDGGLTVRHLYGYANDDLDASVPTDLANVETFARRVGVSYAELIAIIKTRFINPSTVLLPRIERLAVPFVTLRDLHDGTLTPLAFGKLVPRKLDLAAYGGDPSALAADESNYDQLIGDAVFAWLNAGDTYDRINRLITISNPTDANNLCAVDALELRYANPDTNANQLVVVDFVRLKRFIRLWRKLGWTIAQTDAAITALSQSGGTTLADLDARFVALVPRIGTIRGVIDRLQLNVDRDLDGLLACWSPIDIHAADSLYRRMFLSPALVDRDPAFAENGFGDVLDGSETISDHIEALRAAFGLTGDESALILTDVVKRANAAVPPPAPGAPPPPPWTVDDLPLTLENISAMFRHGWLARKLEISVLELLLLEEMTGLDPFAAPGPALPAIDRLLDLVEALRRTAVDPSKLLYLLWDQDISGKAGPEEHHITDLARTLRNDFAQVDSDFVIVDDPTGDIARARMTLVYGAATTDLFFGLLDNTFVVSASYAHPPADSPQPLMTVAPRRVAYDDLAKQLTFAGYLDTTIAAALTSAATASADLQQAVQDLETAMSRVIDPLFEDHPELKTLLDNYALEPPTRTPQEKRATVLASILPELKRLRKREQALATVSAAASTDYQAPRALLDDDTVMHAAGSSADPARDDFTKFETDPNATITGAFTGYLDPRETGFHDFVVEVDPGITVVKLIVDGTDALMFETPAGIWSNAAAITLSPGRLVPIELTVTGTGALTVKWATRGRGREIIPADRVYAQASVDALTTTYTRFLKAVELGATFGLTSNELTYFAQRTDLKIDVTPGVSRPWLDALPIGADPSKSVAGDLYRRLLTLLDVVHVKAALSPDDERVLEVFRDPNVKQPDGEPLLLTLANWDDDSLLAILGRFTKTIDDLRDAATFRRVLDGFALARIAGISVEALINATTNNPDPPTVPNSHVVRDLEAALRARYDAAAWLDVIQPINDNLRVLRRDALIAFVLQQFRLAGDDAITTPDKLFEYFLMDVQMDACMKTSRIRHALSSVQLFIERCLMNLEKRVASETLDAKQWEWMRRYRVWEANRKVFLWPENWLDPELRDHQSPIFKETMSELLQNDITEDTATVAMVNYLTKLEEIAKLEPCGMHLDVERDQLHVVARTAGAHRKYYYRCRDRGTWLPWEQIQLDIEDNPILPYVWKGRLLLFWLKLIKQAPTKAKMPNKTKAPSAWSGDDIAGTADTRITIHAVLCWSEYYNGKWQTMKTSSVDRPAALNTVTNKLVKRIKIDSLSFVSGIDEQKHETPAELTPTEFVRSQLHLGARAQDDALRIVVSRFESGNIVSTRSQWCSFLFYNTHSIPEVVHDNFQPTVDVSNGRQLLAGPPTLKIDFLNAHNGVLPSGEDVLEQKPPAHRHTQAIVVEPLQGLDDWNAPFFYADGRNVFYVRPSNDPLTKSVAGSFDPRIFERGVIYSRRAESITPLINLPPMEDPVSQPAVSEDANIIHALPSTRAVPFGSTLIRMIGSLTDEESKPVIA